METTTQETQDITTTGKDKLKKLFPVFALLVVLAGGISALWISNVSTNQHSRSAKADAAVTPPMQMPNGKTKIMMSALDGSIVIKEIDGKTWVNVNIPTHGEDSAYDKDYPLTIQEGTCANPGAVKYTLNHIADGGSETFLPITLADFRNLLPLSLVAHASESDSTAVACSDISVVY